MEGGFEESHFRSNEKSWQLTSTVLAREDEWCRPWNGVGKLKILKGENEKEMGVEGGEGIEAGSPVCILCS